MKQGDILLMYHRIDPLAWLLCYLSEGRYNHVGWAINDHEIIESIGKGIVISPLSKYKNGRYDLKLIRLKGLSKEKIKRVNNRLLKRQFRDFYPKYLFDYIIMILRRKTHRTTCSNLISCELIKEGYSIKKIHCKFITPEDFNRCKFGKNVTNEL
jgi:hypothetical protein